MFLYTEFPLTVLPSPACLGSSSADPCLLGTRALGLVAAALLLAACGGDVEQSNVVAAPPVMVVSVQVRDVKDRIEATGQLLAKSSASVAAQVGGQITRIHADEGAAVDRGQVILEIDPESRELEFANRQALVAQAEAELLDRRRARARVASLRAKGAASQARGEEAQTQVQLGEARLAAARAQLGLAKRALSDSSVVAPFAGHLARRYVSEGEFVTVGKVLFDLVALENMEVEFHLAERDSSLVKKGHRVEVRVAPFPEETFLATVTVISPTIDVKTRTLRVKAEVDDREGRLRPGLFARADLGVSERTSVLMVPEDAIVLRADGSVVFRLVGTNEVERVPVTTGVHRDGLVEISHGLGRDDMIVVRGQSRLLDGSVVDVRAADGSTPSSFSELAGEAQAAR